MTLTIAVVNQICKDTSWASFLLLPCGGKPSLSHISPAKTKLLGDAILRPALWGWFHFFVYSLRACSWGEKQLWVTDFVYITLWVFSYIIVADQRLEAGFPSSHSGSWAGPGDERRSPIFQSTALPPILSTVYSQSPVQDLCFIISVVCLHIHRPRSLEWNSENMNAATKKKKRPFSKTQLLCRDFYSFSCLIIIKNIPSV